MPFFSLKLQRRHVMQACAVSVLAITWMPRAQAQGAGSSQSLVALAPAGAELLAPQALLALQQRQVTLVDIRRPDEWADTGVAKGAVRLNMQHPQGPTGFAAELLRKVGNNKDAPIALICRTGNRTAQVQHYLQANGFTRVFHVREGMAGSSAGPGWLKRGLPIDKP